MVDQRNGLIVRQMQFLLDIHEALTHFHPLKEVFQGIHRSHVTERFDEGFLCKAEVATLDEEKNKADQGKLVTQVILENLIRGVRIGNGKCRHR